ncbi:MAG: hypothetical protein QOJ58_5726 [Alphaproteobacteria bacterium]|nr:hypothetical protein [Alphaproteobacteria bacterium]
MILYGRAGVTGPMKLVEIDAPNLRSETSHSRRIESSLSTRHGATIGLFRSQIIPQLVKTSGRSAGARSRSRRPTTSSE